MTGMLALAHTLRDPAPPAPDDQVRAAVRARAGRLRHRRRATGALAAASCAALLTVATFAVVDAGSTPDRSGVEAAAAPASARVAVVVDDGAVPAGVELDATLAGDAGTFVAHVRTPGTLTFADVPAGDYELRWDWESDDDTAAAAGRRTVHVDAGDVTLRL